MLINNTITAQFFMEKKKKEKRKIPNCFFGFMCRK